MGLEKAIIQPLNEKLERIGLPVIVLFNPGEYSLEQSNQYVSTVLPGLSSPITHFISGNARTLTMDLHFDTYTYYNGEDVRKYTQQIAGLLDINAELHAPPICQFSWGRLNFRAVIEKVNQKFTMFLETGVPVRAVLNVTFKEYKTFDEQIVNMSLHSSDKTKHVVLKQGDSLWHIADREYGSPDMWRYIASANKIDNPRRVELGRALVLPSVE